MTSLWDDAALNSERTTYSLWFKTYERGWQAWSSESASPTKAASHRGDCLRRFPDAETVLVMRREKREGLSPEREANLVWTPARDE